MKVSAKNIDIKSIRKKALDNKASKKAVTELITKNVEERKLALLKEYESHPVTLEIESGPNSSNISNTLSGYGNLFSFIGFQASSNPTLPVKDLIRSIRLIRTSVKFVNNGYEMVVKSPSLSDFASVTRMPWEAGRSWLLDMEKRISGTGYYLYGKFSESRSGQAIQSKFKYSSVQFRPVKYFTLMFNRFIKSLQRQ